MSTLGETAIVARKAIRLGGIALVVLIVGRVVLTASYNYYKSLYPDPPPPPDVKFGKLPKLVFPQKELASYQYKLQTRTNGLPTNLPDQFKVFFMPIKKPSLLAYDGAKSVATRLDFIQEPKKLSETDYRWDSTDPISASLTFNVITGAFILDKKWQEDMTLAEPTVFLSDEQAQDKLYSLLSRVELLPEDIKTGNSTVANLKADKDQIVSAVSRSQAHFVRVNLYRKDIDSVPVIYPRAERGPITAILALQREEKRQVINLDYNYYPVDLETSAVYPIISVSEAWKRLQAGSGYIVNVKSNIANVTVREISIEFYDAEEPQQFLQPVYVFRGDDDFVGIVPAILDQWVEG